jgi:hypothetical protein
MYIRIMPDRHPHVNLPQISGQRRGMLAQVNGALDHGTIPGLRMSAGLLNNVTLEARV